MPPFLARINSDAWSRENGGIIHRQEVGKIERNFRAQSAIGLPITWFLSEPDAWSATASKNDDAIDEAIAYCSSLTAPHLITPGGLAVIARPHVFSLPNYSTIEAYTHFRYTGTPESGIAAIQIGVPGPVKTGISVIGGGLDISRPTTDNTIGSIGIKVVDIGLSFLIIREVGNFYKGLLTHGEASFHAYNKYILGHLYDNQYNLYCSAAGVAGFNNENNYWGGEFTYTSNRATVGYVGTVNIFEDFNAINELNNNKFWGPSLEGTTDVKAATIHGAHTQFYGARLEGPAGYEFELTSNSRNCRIENTYPIGTIVDNGSGNRYSFTGGAAVDHSLPTADPLVDGQIWRDTATGTLRISNG